MAKNYIVNFIISDTHAHTLPARNGAATKLGTELHYPVNTLKDALRLANSLWHLTTGDREAAFKSDALKGVNSVLKSNEGYTHHVEITRAGVWTKTTNAMKKGVAREYPHPYE